MNNHEQVSEVTRLLQQIQAEFETAQQGLTGLASGNAHHKFITKRMENMGKLHGELRDLVGDSAMALIAKQLETVPETKNSAIS